MAEILKRSHSKTKRNLSIPEVLSATDARQVFFSLLENVEHSNWSYTLTKNGKPVAKIVNPNEWKGLIATLEILASSKHQTELDKAIREVEEGKTHSFEEVFGHKQPNI
ncbi:type II toxin-antitoxin system Phd/YefM family antitoxin [bacterium]|nr:type II toxin-antitoxin system Phd/YefM family antitoxin [bacterium]MBU1599045.1 type II toxin-antitoxin system Phd/YefM family antitoxin [bacterium]MBU2461512.1 type II toxin-antitoxin system Phd/YefM family antitoxin [bacterium]